MASTKEIKSKISSVESTQKITSAMEMVATSKMRHAQEAMNYSKPYSLTLRRVISHIAKSTTHANNPYVKERAVKNVCIVVIGTDRGLCGGLNTNVFKKVLHTIDEYSSKGVQVRLAVVGSKAHAFFDNLRMPIAFSLVNLGDKPSAEFCLGFIQGVVNGFLDGEYDMVEVFANKFINTMTQQPDRWQYLPLPQLPKSADYIEKSSWDYIYEGDSSHLLSGLINRYVEYQIYATILETLACEQAARMIAMKAATDNATQLIDELTLVYNKARQASITNELNEIVAGAAAV